MQHAPPSLLAIDDDQGILTFLSAIASAEGYGVVTAMEACEAMERLRHNPADLVLLDLRMPGVEGLEALRGVRQASPRSRIVMMTGFGTIDTAVEATKLGATDFLTKPFDLPRLRRLLADVREDRARHGVSTLSDGSVQPAGFCGMVGDGPAMRAVFGLLRRLAPHARTVLVTGETGTGKELVARALHQRGPRSRKRFVTVNCSAVVESLFESELFGHLRGSFTGASEHKAGLIETADGGTLFLDEVGELPAPVQAKLLRVLENGEVQRIGALKPRQVDVRLIAATNRDLRAEIAAGRFRADLYYRLNLAEVKLPPLRQRAEDIPDLTATFLSAAAGRLERPVASISPGAQELLMRGEWNGNVRQLRNLIERACMLAESGELSEVDLAEALDDASPALVPGAPTSPEPHASPLRVVERDHITRTLNQSGGNKAVAARLLGISRRAFYRQLERHGLHQRVVALQ